MNMWYSYEHIDTRELMQQILAFIKGHAALNKSNNKWPSLSCIMRTFLPTTTPIMIKTALLDGQDAGYWNAYTDSKVVKYKLNSYECCPNNQIGRKDN